jgi:hypothetical protein
VRDDGKVADMLHCRPGKKTGTLKTHLDIR